MKKFITNKYVLYILGILLFLLIWEIIALLIGEEIRVFPGPFTTFEATFSILGDSYLYKSLLASFSRMLIGFIISFVLSIILGSIAGKSKHIQQLFSPSITAIKAMPTAALVFVFLLLIGAKNTPIVLTIIISFPILYEAVVGGFNNVEKEILETSRLEGANYIQSISRISLPLSKQFILVGISSSFALSFKISIMAEIISGTDAYGIGSAIRNARITNPSDMRPVFAYCLIAVFVILLIDFISKMVKNYYNKKASTK